MRCENLRRALRASLVLAVCLGAVAPPAQAADNSWAQDPVLIYYPRGDCRGANIEIQIFDRDLRSWRVHPVHPLVPVDTCQLEDAGRLLNELRFRCQEPPDTEPPSMFIEIDVFDPRVMEQCASGPKQANSGVELRVTKPEQGSSVRNPTMEVAVEGNVRMNGFEGGEYDLVLVIDRSEAARRDGLDLFEAQLRAAEALVDNLATRLGAVRIGILSYPNLPPLPGDGGTGAHRTIALTADAAALRAAIAALRARGTSGFGTFLTALGYGIKELDPSSGRGARAKARKVLAVAASAKGPLPFGPGVDTDTNFRLRLLAQAQGAQERGIALQLFALAGLVEQTPKGVAAALERSHGTLHRVPLPALESPFFAQIPLPEVREVTIANRTRSKEPRIAQLSSDGHFSLTLPVAPGKNRLLLRAVLSDGSTGEREWDFRFDDSWVNERLLAAERERMHQVRQQKRLRIEPEWQEKDAAPPSGEN